MPLLLGCGLSRSSVTPSRSWLASSLFYSLISASFGVGGSVCAKYGLDDEWTNFFADTARACWHHYALSETDELNEQVQSEEEAAWNQRVSCHSTLR